MGDSEVTLARYYGKGAAGRLNMDRLAVPRQLDPLRAAPGPGPELPAELRRRLRPDRHRVVDRQAHAGRPALAGPVVRGQRARLQRRLPHVHGDRARPRQGDGQRVDRRDHRRHARRSQLAHLPARLPGPGRHAHDVPDRGQDGGDPGPRLDRRAAGRRGLRRLPRAAAAAATSRRSPPAGPTTSSTTPRTTATATSTRSRRSPAIADLDDGKVLGLFNPGNMIDRVRAAVRPHEGVLRRQPGA